MDFLLLLIAGVLLYYGFKAFGKSRLTQIALQPVTDKSKFKPIAIIIDTETTGLVNDNSIRVTKKNVVQYSNNFPRIVQLSFMLVDKKGAYESENYYIKQKEPIPKQALRIHGITNQKCEEDGIELSQALSELTVNANRVDTIVGHKVSFDYKVLHSEYIKSGNPFPLKGMNKVDTMNLVSKHLGHKYGFRISLYNSAEKLFGKVKEWQELKKQLKEHDSESDVIVTALLFNALNKK